jgi:hypothetical protein
LLIAISVIGILDHRHKNAVMGRTFDAPWYCEHQHVRCDEARQRQSVEDRWNARETGYQSALVVIAALTLLVAARGLYARPRQRSVRSTTPGPSERPPAQP